MLKWLSKIRRKGAKDRILLSKCPVIPEQRMPVDISDDPTVYIGTQESFREVITGSFMHIGTRDYQQDALFVTDTVGAEPGHPIRAYAVLCDGMGGLSDGEKASKLVVESFSESLAHMDADTDKAEFFRKEVARLDELVCAECGEKDGGVPTAGTTLTAVLVEDGLMWWLSVGDSRIYIARQGEFEQISRDHNYLMLLREYVKQGRMRADEAESHPKRAALISFIGAGGVRHIDVNSTPFPLKHGDIVLLCSDGLTKSLTDEEIREQLSEHYGDIPGAAEALTLSAFDKGDGSKDNTSVVLLQYFE